jgi:hypothetical protein
MRSFHRYSVEQAFIPAVEDKLKIWPSPLEEYLRA